MASLEPSIVTFPLFRTDIFTPTSRAAVSTLTTLATKITTVTATSTAVVTVSESAAADSTSTGIPPLPAAFDSPLATGKDDTSAFAIVTLVAVILCATLLLVLLCYYIFLRLRGQCPHCPRYEDELKKYKNRSSLKRHTGATEQGRMRDVEKGLSPVDEQAHQHRIRMRAQSLARLENRPVEQAREDRTAGDQALGRLRSSQIEAQRDRGSSSRASSEENEHPEDFEKAPELVNQVAVQKPTPAHLAAPVSYDEEATLVNPTCRNPDFNKTYDDYLQDVVAPREAERKAQEAAAWLDIASDPKTRESVKMRAVAKANAQMIEMDTIKEGIDETATVTRQVGGSRFREHLSWETKSYHDTV